MSNADRAGQPRTLGKTIAPARFVAFLVLLVAGTALAMQVKGAHATLAIVLGFDGAALVFLLSLLPLLRITEVASIRRHARDNDANRVLVLTISVLTMLAVLAALLGELPRAANGDQIAVGALLVTLALTWLFINAIFSLHYAHLFYAEDSATPGRDSGGLQFPGTDQPDYVDFIYFSATLGMTFQTSDVTVASRTMRRVVLGQSLTAFVFNLGVVSLVINALGGLAG